MRFTSGEFLGTPVRESGPGFFVWVVTGGGPAEP